MPQPVQTPNRATLTRPQRSSRRVAHKRPLAWLPWALLALLLLLVALAVVGIRAARSGDDTAAGTPAPAPTAPAGGSGTSPSGAPGSGSGSAGSGTAGSGTAGSGTAALSAVAGGALVGGGGTAAAPAGTAGSQGLTGQRDPGTAGTVLFDEGSAGLDADAQQVVDTAATNLRTAQVKAVQVVGYTDVVAGTPVNGALSQQRAEAVATALRRRLPGVTVTTVAKGETEPIADNDTAEGRQQNRRAAIVAQS